MGWLRELRDEVWSWFVGPSWGARFIREYQEAFPGRCPVCGFHRAAIQEGHERPGSKPAPHRCPDVTIRKTMPATRGDP
jgi:hypothetical protein